MNYITDRNKISTDALYDTDYIVHALSWGRHRYVRREGSPGNWRYIYPEDLRRGWQNFVTGARNTVRNAKRVVNNAAKNAVNTARNTVTSIRERTSDLTSRVNSFLKSEVGIGQRKEIRAQYVKARNAAHAADEARSNITSIIIKHPGDKPRSPERIASYEAAQRRANIEFLSYENAVQRYGETFLGEIEDLLNTPYDRVQPLYANYVKRLYNMPWLEDYMYPGTLTISADNKIWRS